MTLEGSSASVISSPDKMNSTESHPVFSDYTHIADVRDICFAAGLREENPQDLIKRILPLTKFIPKVEMEKRKVKKKAVAVVVEESTCERSDCSIRKGRLQELKVENKPLRDQCLLLELRISTLKNKRALAEKAFKITENKIDNLNNEIEDIQARITSTEDEVTRADNNNKGQREQLHATTLEVTELKKQLEVYLSSINAIYASEYDKVKFKSSTISAKSLRSYASLPSRQKSLIKEAICGELISDDVQSVMSIAPIVGYDEGNDSD